MKASPLPSVEVLLQCFDYYPETGALIWKRRPIEHFKNAHAMNTFNAQHAGNPCVATHAKGYVTARIQWRNRLAHRLIWKIVTGADPTAHIDHINGNTSDNRWSNLRQATQQQNGVNRGASIRSKTGIKGVVFEAERQRYAAYIGVNGKSRYIGRFHSLEDAAAAQSAAELAAHGSYAHNQQAQKT